MSNHLDMSKTAVYIRKTLGLTQRAAAKALGITAVHLCNVENGRGQPSLDLIDKYQQVWGVDLYVLAWCREGNPGPSLGSEIGRIGDFWHHWLLDQAPP